MDRSSPRLSLLLFFLSFNQPQARATNSRIGRKRAFGAAIGESGAATRVTLARRRLSRRSREEKGAESAVSGFARAADAKDEERERSLPITRRSFNYAAPVDRARTVRRR